MNLREHLGVAMIAGALLAMAAWSHAADAEAPPSANPDPAASAATLRIGEQTEHVTLDDVMRERTLSMRFMAVQTTESLRREQAREMIRQVALRKLACAQAPAGELDRDTTLSVRLETALNEFLVQRLRTDVQQQADATPSDAEIEAYYQAHKNDYVEPERFTIQYVFSYIDNPNDPAKLEAARRRIEEAKAKIDQGADFGEVARQYSNSPSGNAGERVVFEPGKLNPTIENAVREMADGEVGGVLKAGSGFMIIRRIGHQPAGQKPLDEVRDQVRSMLVAQAQAASWEQFNKEMLARLKPTLNSDALQNEVVADAAAVFRFAGREVRFGEVRPRLEAQARSGGAAPTTAARNQELNAIFQEMLLVHEARAHGLDKGAEYDAVRERKRCDLIFEARESRLMEKLRGEASADDAAIERYYREHPAYFRIERETRIQVLRAEAATTGTQAGLAEKAAAFQRIEEARRRLEAGEDFAALMKEFNGDWDGDWDFAPYGPRGRVIDMAVEKLKPGQTSAPVEYGKGFYLIKLLEAREPEPLPLETVRGRIGEIVRGEQARRRLQEIHEQELADNGFTIDEKTLEQIVGLLAPQ